MLKNFPLKNNFTAGEISSSMYSRIDTNKYQNGASKIENFHVLPQGGLLRRSGTQYIEEVKTSSKKTRLIEFIFSESQAYVLEFGENYIRIYREEGLVLDSSVPVEITTTFLENELFDIYYTQSADVLFLAHPNHYPKRLIRNSDTSWTFENIPNQDGPYLDLTTTSEMKLSNVQHTATLVSTDNNFASEDVGLAIEYLCDGKFCLGEIKTFVNPKEIVINVLENVLDFREVVKTAIVEYRESNSSFPDRLGSNVAIWSRENENQYIRLYPITYTLDPYTTTPPYSSSAVNTYFSAFIGSGRVARSGILYYVVTGFQIEVTFRKTSGVELSTVQFQYDNGGVWTAASDNFTGASSGGAGTFTHVFTMTYSGFVRLTFEQTTGSGGTIEEIDTDYDVSDLEEGVWYLTGQNIPENETIAASGTKAARSDDVIEVLFTAPMKRYVGNVSLKDETITGNLESSVPIFDAATDIGRQLRLHYIEERIWLTIDSVISNTEAQVSVSRQLPIDTVYNYAYVSNGKTSRWQLGAWYTNNYPSVVNFHDNRLNYYSTPLEQQTHWTSRAGNIYDFSPTDNDSVVTDDAAITKTLNSGTGNEIRWAVSADTLLVGTAGDEFRIRSDSLNEVLTPSSYNARRQTSWGSIGVIPELVGDSIIFAQLGGNIVREMLPSNKSSSYLSYFCNYLNIVAEHIFRERGGIKDIACQRNPNTRLWFVTDTGDLVSCSYEKEQEVVAFATHKIAGVDAKVESIVVVPNQIYDELWMVVKRTINSSVVRYVEKLSEDYRPQETYDLTDMRFLDSWIAYEGSPISSVSGLTHLEGETVQVMADGTQRDDQIVSSGSINISGNAASKIQVGLNYSSTFKSLPVETGGYAGEPVTKNKRINALRTRLVNSTHGSYGASLSDLMDMNMNSSSTELFTGVVLSKLDKGYENYLQYYIQQNNPYPMHLLSVTPEITTYE